MCKIIKSADDTVVVVLMINDYDERNYWNSIDYIIKLCDESYLKFVCN